MPAAPSGLVSEYNATNDSNIGRVIDSVTSIAMRLASSRALAIVSIKIVLAAPVRSSSAPANGLAIMPGTIEVKDTQPASAGDSNRFKA